MDRQCSNCRWGLHAGWPPRNMLWNCIFPLVGNTPVQKHRLIRRNAAYVCGYFQPKAFRPGRIDCSCCRGLGRLVGGGEIPWGKSVDIVCPHCCVHDWFSVAGRSVCLECGVAKEGSEEADNDRKEPSGVEM
jgi:hypothetical protein